MKPQDILIISKIFCAKDTLWSTEKIAAETGLSRSETHNSTKRLYKAGLLNEISQKPVIEAMEEFLIHGIRYVFPPVLLPNDRGILTAHSAPPLNSVIIAGDDEQYVWPHPEGSERGICIKPLYPTVPSAALKDNSLYEILSLIEALRIGRVRERKIASDMLSGILLGKRV